MGDDLLKEQLMGYARDGAEAAVQPSAAAIYRRARHHYQRVAALAVTGVLAAGGIGIALGLRGTTPTVTRPQPPVTSPGPQVVPPSTAPPTTTPHPTTTTGAVQARPPSSFVTLVGPPNPPASQAQRVGVVSTSTGKVIRYLSGPLPADASVSRPVVSADRVWVYYTVSAGGGPPKPTGCRSPAVPPPRSPRPGAGTPSSPLTDPSCSLTPGRPLAGGTGSQSEIWPAGLSASSPSHSLNRPGIPGATELVDRPGLSSQPRFSPDFT